MTKPVATPAKPPVKPPVFSRVVVYPVSDLSRWYIAAGYMTHFPDYPKDQLGRIQYHTGLDYNLKTGGDTDLGQPIYAVAAGKVVDASSSVIGFGNVIMIEHPQLGVWTRYAHLKGFAKGITKNSVVQAGQLIGYLGKSGTKFAHLHFDVSKEFRGVRFWGATDRATVAKVYADTLPWFRSLNARDVGDA